MKVRYRCYPVCMGTRRDHGSVSMCTTKKQWLFTVLLLKIVLYLGLNVLRKNKVYKSFVAYCTSQVLISLL